MSTCDVNDLVHSANEQRSYTTSWDATLNRAKRALQANSPADDRARWTGHQGG